ncbi:MAG: TauD/TfdA family dioxygenase [Actinomycetota bacterium]|jgi:taurine dioxygenase|nr:TauD/TfdA family dioxygenase [Actinomycetota bacterium]
MSIQATSVGQYDHIKVSPVTGAIGVEVSNVDLRELDDEVLAEIQDAWMAHKVLFFRDQDLTQEQHVAYGRALGDLEVHPFTDNVSDHPEIIVVESTPEKWQSADIWHSDVTFRECPPLGSVLLGRVIPPYGGDTCWANMELAYDLLDDDTKEAIDGRYAIHSYVKAFGRNMTDEQKVEVQEKYPDQKHPVVRTHPVTGAKALFVNRIFTLTIDGMTPDESRPLRRRLCEQAAIAEIQCRFRWQVGSIAQWDNRCTQHYAVPDYGGHHRRVERVTLIGDRPV